MTGVGKTTWVKRYLKEHPGEHWTVINAENLLNQMRVRECEWGQRERKRERRERERKERERGEFTSLFLCEW